ncbi:MAG: DUF5694 domain-containing protein [Cyclobacteriaceae bacterium]
MKSVIYTCLIALSILCQAQRLDIMIVGTVHHFDDEYKHLQNFEKIQNDIIAFNPEIICIEAIPINDTLSLKEIWPKNMKRAEELSNQLSQNAFDSVATPIQIKGAVRFAEYDFWNAWYLWDSLLINGGTAGPFSEYHRKLQNSEYGNIVFPAARTVGIRKFQSIDYRVGEQLFLENQNKALKKLLFKFKWKPLGTYMRLQKKYKKAQKSGQLMAFVNRDEFQSSFATLIDELPTKLKKSEEAKNVKSSWHRRNKIMADRIYEAALSTNSTRVVVTVGSAHVGHIKYYLEKLNCSVITYGELLSQTEND